VNNDSPCGFQKFAVDVTDSHDVWG
jgi:hypothetical protein